MFKKIFSGIIIITMAICSITILAGCDNGKSEEQRTVTCFNGKFVGGYNSEKDVFHFEGIPYAKPPVESLRWKAPVPCDDSEETYDATHFGKNCLQTESTEQCWGDPMGEDCLYLNVWTRNLDTKNKPVIVWIHGGSYGWGGTSDRIYNGENFVKDNGDVIMVTINYRLNALGFIDFSNVPGGENFKDTPYLGILDQQMALKWIQKNIANFGGDPNNVTIAGESAGGGSVICHLVAKGSEGLFQHAVAMSGVNLNFKKKKFEENNQAGELLKVTGCKTMDDLMNLSESELQSALSANSGTMGMENGSKVADHNNWPLADDDSSIVPTDITKAIVNGASKDVDLVIGTTGDEMRYWVWEMGHDNVPNNMEDFYSYILGRIKLHKELNPTEVENINKAIELSSPQKDKNYDQKYPHIWEYTDIAGELAFRDSSIRMAEAHINAGGKGKTFMYQFNKRGTDNNWIGACHGCELLYVFNNNQYQSHIGYPAMKLAKPISASIASFAINGNPSSNLEWPEYNQSTRPTMVVNDDLTFNIVNDPKSEIRQLLKNCIKKAGDD